MKRSGKVSTQAHKFANEPIRTQPYLKWAWESTTRRHRTRRDVYNPSQGIQPASSSSNSTFLRISNSTLAAVSNIHKCLRVPYPLLLGMIVRTSLVVGRSRRELVSIPTTMKHTAAVQKKQQWQDLAVWTIYGEIRGCLNLNGLLCHISSRRRWLFVWFLIYIRTCTFHSSVLHDKSSREFAFEFHPLNSHTCVE